MPRSQPRGAYVSRARFRIAGMLVFPALFSGWSAAAFAQAQAAPPVPAATPSAPVTEPAAAPSPAPVSASSEQSQQWLKVLYEKVADAVVVIDTETGTGSGFFFHTRR